MITFSFYLPTDPQHLWQAKLRQSVGRPSLSTPAKPVRQCPVLQFQSPLYGQRWGHHARPIRDQIGIKFYSTDATYDLLSIRLHLAVQTVQEDHMSRCIQLIVTTDEGLVRQVYTTCRSRLKFGLKTQDSSCVVVDTAKCCAKQVNSNVRSKNYDIRKILLRTK